MLSYKKGFTSNVILLFMLLYLAFVDGVNETVVFIAAIALLFAISGLVYILAFNIIDKAKPNATSLKLILLIASLSYGLYYYGQINSIIYSCIVGVGLGVVVIIIYFIAALIDKLRN